MNRPSTSGSAGTRPGVAGRALPAVREVLDQLRSPGARRDDTQPKGGDVRAAVLTVLAEQPATGYAIVRALEERAVDERTPGAGAVYPTLQLLGDEGLATAEETDGRRTWTLTPAGRAAAEAAARRPEQRDGAAARGPEGRRAIARSGTQLAQAAALAAQTGTPQQVSEVAAVLDRARREVLAILARS